MQEEKTFHFMRILCINLIIFEIQYKHMKSVPYRESNSLYQITRF
jgi:hypothetical protein